MIERIKFASIPKCASRSLKALGLLGELPGRCHTKITDYPDWKDYKWFVVDRPELEWLGSWWDECKRTRSMFGEWAGFQYKSLNEDLGRLKNTVETVYEDPDTFMDAPLRPGLNAWLPPGFSFAFHDCGLSFKDFCFASITDGVPYEIVQLADLDIWLRDHGLEPIHMNERDKCASMIT